MSKLVSDRALKLRALLLFTFLTDRALSEPDSSTFNCSLCAGPHDAGLAAIKASNCSLLTGQVLLGPRGGLGWTSTTDEADEEELLQRWGANQASCLDIDLLAGGHKHRAEKPRRGSVPGYLDVDSENADVRGSHFHF
eukprot:1282318-Rhodomonas_salina.1